MAEAELKDLLFLVLEELAVVNGVGDVEMVNLDFFVFGEDLLRLDVVELIFE